MTDLEELKEFLSLQNQNVRKNVSIRSKEDVGQDVMLHIDSVSPDYFMPMMPRNAAMSEDNTLARVTVADSITGCILAYARLVTDLIYRPQSGYQNGYQINSLEFDYALKPNSSLVYDADDTDEYWLVGYNKKNLKFKPKQIGKMFPSEFRSIPNPRKRNNHEYITVLMELSHKGDIKFNRKQKLKAGYYKIDIDATRMNDSKGGKRLNLDDTDCFALQTITKEIFEAAKKISAPSLESDSVKEPLYNNW